MRSPAPVPPIAASLILPAIFSVFFFSFWIFSFNYSLLFLLSFSFSSYSSLLISSYSSRRAILHLLILLLLYFKLFVVLHTCILTIYLHIYVISEGFFEEAKPFLSSYSSLLYYILPLLILLL
jgi:hypothetical protein